MTFSVAKGVKNVKSSRYVILLSHQLYQDKSSKEMKK